MTTAAPVTYSATITISSPAGRALFRGRPFYRVRVVVDDVVGFTDDLLFVHQRVAAVGEDNSRDIFIGVAGPVDLVDLTDTPNEQLFFRKNQIDILIESHLQFDQTVELVRNGIRELINGLYRLGDMEILQTETIV